MRTILLTLFISTMLLTVHGAMADTPTTGTMPPMRAIVMACREAGFGDDVCNPSPKLAPLISIPKARLANGNTGLLWVTVIGISFASDLNEERFLLPYKDITGICVDHTLIVRGDERFTTEVPLRHYFRITLKDHEVTFWVPGGTGDTNNLATFVHAVFNHILPVTRCDLRPTE